MNVSPSIRLIRQRAVPILRRYGVRKAAIFGSYARGEEHKRSDVDILVEAPKTMSLLGLTGLELDLKECLARKVDVVTYRSLHHLIKDRILREQVVIYEKRS
jgi:predicted nucleotidyltransferase